MPVTGHTVIVGAGAAGVATAETLRAENFQGGITIIGEEPLLPYHRPPLARQVLSGTWDLGRTLMRTARRFVDNEIDLRLGTSALSVDTEAQSVVLTGEEVVSYDQLVVATGVVPRRLPFGPHLRGIHTLRSQYDLIALQETLARAHRIVIVGAGFLGTEVASVLVDRLDVTLINPLPAPMYHQLGPAVGGLIADLHRQRGVNLINGIDVSDVEGRDGRVWAVHLSDGRTLMADAVLVTIGADPATDWLQSSSLALDDGIVCDAFCRAAPNVYAAGDVASWSNLRYGGARMRLEHYSHAVDHGAAVARNIVGHRPTPFTPLPRFWTDQFEFRLDAYGLLGPNAHIEHVDGLPGERRFVVLYTLDDQLVGVLGWNHPTRAQLYRHIIYSSWPDAEAIASADPP